MKDRKRFDEIAQRQGGLKKQLTAGQMSMLAIGGAIGTGLFLGARLRHSDGRTVGAAELSDRG
jgi:amino acid permease